jgi:uncharacterized membrane protein YcaP (DUF421 family)
MFELGIPWWEFIVRGVLVYLALLIMVRISGKRTIGQFSPFDVIVMLLVAEAAQGPLTANDESVMGGLITIASLIALNFGFAFVSARWRPFDKVVQGEPVILVSNGVVHHDRLRRNNLPMSDLEEAMRAGGASDTAEIKWAILEPDGEISIKVQGN